MGKHQAGFTLLELIAVLAIAGILISLATPSFIGFIANQRVKTSSQDLFLAMMEARSEAIKRNSTVTLTAKTESGTTNWNNGWEIKNDGGDVLKTHESISDIVVTKNTTSISYLRSGRLDAAASPSIVICDSKGYATQRTISADLTGRPKIERTGDC